MVSTSALPFNPTTVSVTTTGSTTTAGTWTVLPQPQPGMWAASTAPWNTPSIPYPPPISIEQTDHIVFSTPIKDLMNMWLAKFGEGWVNYREALEDEFYRHTIYRLAKAGKMEDAIASVTGETFIRIVME